MIIDVNFISAPMRDQDRALAFYSESWRLRLISDQPFGPEQRWIGLGIGHADTPSFFSRRQARRRQSVVGSARRWRATTSMRLTASSPIAVWTLRRRRRASHGVCSQ